MKKGQLTVFIIIGLVAVMLVGIFAYSMVNRETKAEVASGNQESDELSLERMQLEDNRDNCIDSGFDYGLTHTGFDTFDLSNYIAQESFYCLNRLYQGENEVDYEGPAVTVNLNENSIDVELIYPISKDTKNGKIELNEVHRSYPLINHVELPVDSEGYVTEDLVISSTDGEFTVNIPKGVRFVDYDGNIITDLDVKIQDKYLIGGTKQPQVVGYKVWEVTDSFVEQGTVKISMQYYPELLDENYQERDLYIMQYNKEYGYWVLVPDTVRDYENNILSADVTHFSSSGPTTQKPMGATWTVFFQEHITSYL